MELEAKGEKVDHARILAEVKLRDEQDSSRDVAPLKPAEDALILDSTKLSIEEVFGVGEEYDESGPGPIDQLEREHFGQELAKAIDQLPQKEALVLSLYYDEELNLREIGEVLGVSESRVCQIHGQALIRLRAKMQKWAQGEYNTVS